MKFDTNRNIKYWVDSSDRDYKAMLNLYKSRDYMWTLFVGHLVIEKLLKASYVKAHENHPPFTHGLFRLVELTKLEPSDDIKNVLDRLTTFNINSRYDDVKHSFYKQCTKEFTVEWLDKIKGLRKWIKKQL